GKAKHASPHLQDRNPSMEGTPVQSSATQSPVATHPVAFIGIDLAKGSFQAAADADAPAACFNASFTYDADGIAQLLERLKTLDVSLIVMEATGGRERNIAPGLF